MSLSEATPTNHNYVGACTCLVILIVILILIWEFGFHGLGFLCIFANVEFIVWISHPDVIMRIAGCGFPILIACCGFQGLDFLSRCEFQLSKRGNQVDG